MTEQPTTETETLQSATSAPDATKGVMTDAFVKDVLEAVSANDSTRLFSLTEKLSAEDFADIIELCSDEQRDALMTLIKPRFDPEVLPLLNEDVREDVVEQLNTEELVEAISSLETDDAVEVIENLDQNVQRAVLSAMPLAERDALRTVLSYPEESAGRLMQKEFLAAPDDWNVQQTVDTIRARTDRPDAFYDVFVVNNEGHVLGSVPLHRLITSRSTMPLSELMDEQNQRIPVTMDEKEVAYIFQRYGLVSAPVEDETHRLVGMITIDDVIDIIQENATEELVHLSGVSEPDFYADVMETTQSRFTWLFVNLVTAIVASWVISFFEGALQKSVLLAVLMPIVASQGGNAGTQTLAVTVRGLALKELSWINALRFLKKEISVGGFNGLLFGAIVALFVGAWYGQWGIALVIAMAMTINLVAAALAGSLIPLVLHKFKIDPAISSSALVTTVTDCIGYASFLGLATLLLMK